MKNAYRINSGITASEIRLVLDDGEMYGIVALVKAMNIGRDKGLDVVEVSPSRNGEPPICKLIDYGKLKYENKKHKKNNHVKKIKEIKYGFNISDHDLAVKHRKVMEFLSKDMKVKYILEIRGRQSMMVEEGKEKILFNLEMFKDVAKWDEPKLARGRSFSCFSTILISS